MLSLDVQQYLLLEPAYFLFNLAIEIAHLATLNLYLQKTCRNSTLSEPDLRTPCDNERNGIEFVASVNSRYLLWCNIFTAIVNILLTAWIDKAASRSKFSILLLLWIRLLQLISMCLNAYFWHWPPWVAVITEMIYYTTPGTRVASIVYICKLSSTESRTFRLTLLYVIELLSTLIGNGASGYLLRYLGFLYTYMLCAALVALSVIHATVFLKSRTNEKTQITLPGCVRGSCEIFDVRSVIQAFRLVLRKRSGNERIVIVLMSVINTLSLICFYGELSVLYIYLRYRFGWNEKDYGIYGLYKTVGICVGSVICLAISKYGKIEDSALGLFAAFWDTLASVGYYFATENWQLYLVLLFDIFHGFAVRVCDSIQSKFFKTEEFGQLFSVHISANILFVLTIPLFSLVFQNTMDSAPASLFILSFSLNISVGVLYGICHILIRRMPKTD